MMKVEKIWNSQKTYTPYLTTTGEVKGICSECL